MKRVRPDVRKKKKVYKKKYQKLDEATPRALSNNRLHVIKRHADGGVFNVVNLSFTGVGQNFSLDQVPGYTELTAMYDQYKICGLKVTFYPAFTNRSTISAVDQPSTSARFGSVIDYTDNTGPSSMDQLREYENFKCTPINEIHTRYIDHPKFLNNSGQVVNDWIACQTPTTKHFGIKYGSDAMMSTGTLSFPMSIEVVYYLCFRNIK